MFKKILIANRGEIACRVIETARFMGIETVAVYSDADAQAKHVEMADEAYRLGPPEARESYLLGDLIIDIAKESGAEAIHPGYGFLSENAEFSESCAAAGIAFIGPPASAIRAMGSKSEAKSLMEKASVPLVQGYHGDNQDPDYLAEMADAAGYPVMIKASAGGGGKGMRLVEKASDFKASLESCKRESINSFGDDKVLVERFVTKPRHIEMQVFADSHGNAVHLFERDCSIQRRHQKVLEEAPAPGMTDDLREKMGEAAVNAAKAIGYQGAGTVEFIVATNKDGTPGDFFFMEMNTRLQVEHPVTEMITGQDLVEWQLRVASGGALPLGQPEITCTGHALEARLYAEDPDNEFLPATGELLHFEMPEDGETVRIDSGVRSGDEVSVYYDPMIAKLIVWGEDRNAALRQMTMALKQTEVAGLTTNRDFLSRIVSHEAFENASLDTAFIERYEKDLLPEKMAASHVIIALAAVANLVSMEELSQLKAEKTADPHSPWSSSDGWRLNDVSHIDLTLNDGGQDVIVKCHHDGNGFSLEIEDTYYDIQPKEFDGNFLRVELDGYSMHATIIIDGTNVTVVMDDETRLLQLIDPMLSAGDVSGGDDQLTAPMPGKITVVHAKPGDKVTTGQALLVLEAMKMEHTIIAPKDGVIAEMFYAAGDQVNDGAELVTFEEGD